MSSGKWRPFCLGRDVFMNFMHSHRLIKIDDVWIYTYNPDNTDISFADQQNLYLAQHFEAETKWLRLLRRCFQMHFLEWKCLNFD